ncbi:MAG: hypothetical protein K2Z81_10365 [Cyanobacteria bacterium]|nr:hypothetical protein [Cyanobacteriota bacterium]
MNWSKNSIILVLFAYTCAAPAWSSDPQDAPYMPWGVDEYELIGTETSELTRKFKDTLLFDNLFTHAKFCHTCGCSSGSGPQFILKVKLNRISSVQRMFIDGFGCKLKGPELSSRKEALKYFIEGMSKIRNKNDEEKRKLASAQQMLKGIAVR